MFRNFVFTLNNYTNDDITLVKGLPYKYLIYGLEVGESKTPHLQGYCELTKRTRFNALKKLLPKAHMEKRKGTAQQAADYCKKDGKYTELGVISAPGTRSDLATVYNLVKEGKSDIEIGEAHPGTYMKYYKAIDRVRFNYSKLDNKWSKVNCVVMYGDAGSGKTRKAYELFPDLHRLVQGDTLWYDGYDGQSCLLIDDFYGWIKYGNLLQLLDGYKYALPIKGGFTWKRWSTVIITSNVHPRMWYKKGMTPALKRRISKIVECGLVLPRTSGTA